MQDQKSNRGTIDIMHEEFLIKALKRSNGNRKKTAKLLGITEKTVYRKMVKYGIPIRLKKKKVD